ncbi:hypothetical protein [Sphingomonas immobilis]|uniref:Uncharacterized protein n=1 Tax=Sphingomonas immobilis TaxID=3063997 RepID=A0ABT8ZW78_9SPHN|nr:hypothetical protein [Sphingomonas sp. CA1-15]MDO7841830.1 hypothetical protein [Sphingomonas sp. CA1-15]
MWHIGAFLIWLTMCCGLAALVGGAAERRAAALLVLAYVASFIAARIRAHSQYTAVYYDAWIIDLLLLIALYVLAIRSTRFWPMWLVAIHVLAVIAHLLRVIDPLMMFEGYYGIINLAGWPMAGIVGIAAFRHRYRVRRFGSDPSFATF